MSQLQQEATRFKKRHAKYSNITALLSSSRRQVTLRTVITVNFHFFFQKISYTVPKWLGDPEANLSIVLPWMDALIRYSRIYCPLNT